jgi:hypothetical protein
MLQDSGLSANVATDAVDIGLGHGEESVESIAVELYPLVPYVVGDGRVLPGENLELVMGVNYLSPGRDDESSIEKLLGKRGVLHLGPGYDVAVVLLGFPPQLLGFLARNIESHLLDVFFVVQVEHLIGEALQTTLRDADQTHRQVDGAESRCRVDQFGNVADVDIFLSSMVSTASLL